MCDNPEAMRGPEFPSEQEVIAAAADYVAAHDPQFADRKPGERAQEVEDAANGLLALVAAGQMLKEARKPRGNQAPQAQTPGSCDTIDQ